jgi:RNA polymerase sigma-70 factor, ECF subfamily
VTPKEAIERLYQEHGPKVFAAAYSVCWNWATASEICQEAFLRLLEMLERGEAVRNERALLFCVAGNLARDYNRGAFRRNGTHPPEVMTGIRSAERSPLESAAHQDAEARMRAAFATLALEDRVLLWLRHVEELTLREVGEIMEMKLGQVYQRLNVLHARLRAHPELSGLDDGLEAAV